MAKLVETKTYALVLNQDELNILYQILVDSAYIDDDIVYDIAETIVGSVDNFKCDDESLQPTDENEDDVDMPF